MSPKQPDAYLGLTTAAGIAYDQIAERKRGVYDVEDFNEVLNKAAQALIRITPVYLLDPANGERRRLSDAELLEVRVTNGATVLELADGRRIKDLSVVRGDLTAAIKILREAGLKAFSSAPPG